MRFLSYLVFGLALAACSSSGGAGQAARGFAYTPPDTPGGRMCVHQCDEAQDYCRQNCALTQRRCTNGVQTQALSDYDKYTREQFAAHEEIELYPSDFERMQPCNEAKDACVSNCETRYQSCYQDCGGKVSPK